MQYGYYELLSLEVLLRFTEQREHSCKNLDIKYQSCDYMAMSSIN